MESPVVVVSSGMIRSESDLKRFIWTASEPQIDGSQTKGEGCCGKLVQWTGIGVGRVSYLVIYFRGG